MVSLSVHLDVVRRVIGALLRDVCRTISVGEGEKELGVTRLWARVEMVYLPRL